LGAAAAWRTAPASRVKVNAWDSSVQLGVAHAERGQRALPGAIEGHQARTCAAMWRPPRWLSFIRGARRAGGSSSRTHTGRVRPQVAGATATAAAAAAAAAAEHAPWCARDAVCHACPQRRPSLQRQRRLGLGQQLTALPAQPLLQIAGARTREQVDGCRRTWTTRTRPGQGQGARLSDQ
jgi:hypothetical protein